MLDIFKEYFSFKKRQISKTKSTNQLDFFANPFLATIVDGDPKALFSIATTSRSRGGRHSFPWITPLYPWYVPYIAQC